MLLGKPRELLRLALEDAFQSFDELNRFSKEALQFSLLLKSAPILQSGIEALITEMDQKDELDVLVAAARTERPKNARLREIEQRLLNASDPFADVQAPAALLPKVTQTGAEAIIVASAGFPSAASFISALGLAELRVCTLSYALPGGKSVCGTGFLIADDLILTNEHVIRRATTPTSPFTLAGTQISAGFDFRTPGTAPREYPLADSDWLVASNPERLEDGTQGLDYAVVRLKTSVGAEPAGVMTDAPERGFLKPVAYRPSANEPILILQHPYDELDAKQSPMRLTIGFVLDAADGVIRHSANSSPGSSGAPIFNSRMELIGLHHWGSPDFNRGIQIGAIKEDLIKKGLRMFS